MQSVAPMAAALQTCRHSPGCGRLPLGIVITEPRLHVRGLTASAYRRQELHQGLNIADFAAELLLSRAPWHKSCTHAGSGMGSADYIESSQVHPM